MGDGGSTRLASALGARPPDALGDLAPKDLADLAKALEQARSRQSVELDDAIRGSLDHIPRLLRGPARRLLG